MVIHRQTLPQSLGDVLTGLSPSSAGVFPSHTLCAATAQETGPGRDSRA